MHLGATGESMACAELQRRGYRILATNFRTRHGEIDIVAQQGEVTVFVEVKTRRSAAFGPPKAAVGPVKQLKLRRMAAIWLSRQRISDVRCRFDVVGIFLPHPEEAPEVEVLQNAF